MNEEAKAAQEIAKTAGKIIDATRETGGFLAKFIKGPLEQGIGIFEDKLKYLRWERQIRLMDRANEFLRLRGLKEPSRAVPMTIAIPILQQGSMEESNDLQDLWAKLLVNAGDAASGVEVRPAFIGILKELSHLDAIILEKVYAVPEEKRPSLGFLTKHLPEKVSLVDSHSYGSDDKPRLDVQIAIANLIRLGLLEGGTLTGDIPKIFYAVDQTRLGREFVKACSNPSA